MDYRDSRTETFLKEATVRKLRELSSLPVGFLDASYQFDTTAGQDNYSAGYLNFPVDVYTWNGEPYVITSTSPISAKHFIKGPKPISEIRAAYRGIAAVSSLYPSSFAWYLDTMWFSETPTGVVTIRGDYRRDGRRDSASGALITTASTTHTNGWFDEGENLLRVAVLLEYHESISKDSVSIQTYQDQYFDLRAGLKEATAAIRTASLQVEDSMFGTSEPGIVGHS